MAEAYTGPFSSKITDTGLCYSARGELTDLYKSTQNSGGYYHTTATYWANGALASLGGLSTVPAFTFSADGEGRPLAVSASFGLNPVTGTSYNAASQVTGVNLGSGDSDSFLFDGNTGRMTKI
jgi:hypothetical protein